jgi:diadenosine tetraphosphate (Ap4A) HIT family hydrolase
MDAPIPGGYVVEAEHFLVEHAPIVESSSGTLIIEARRHLLDFGDMAPTESNAFGSILHRLVPAIKSATGVERVYYLSFYGGSGPLPSLAHTEEERGRTYGSGLHRAAATSYLFGERG